VANPSHIYCQPIGSQKGAKSRLLHYLIGYGPPVLIAEYFYPLDPTPSGTTSDGLVELLAVDRGGQFLSLESSTEQLGKSEKIFQLTTGGRPTASSVGILARVSQPVSHWGELERTRDDSGADCQKS